MIRWFECAHLPSDLQAVARPFGALAVSLMELSESPECQVALRKLLEAKDAAVRAAIDCRARPSHIEQGEK